MQYNNDWLIRKYKAKERLDFTFFWGHKGEPGHVTKSCFSQWWPAAFTESGHTYVTAEHWMMAGKARLFNDPAMEEEILRAPSPAIAKQLGRKVKNFDAAKWDAEKFSIVVKGNLLKFSQHPKMQDFLLSTGETIIVEASPMDRIWGIGMSASHEHAANPLLWKGQNLLGYVLMEVRDQLKQQ
jgi:ribA/ribD-fused uncharacterized protein